MARRKKQQTEDEGEHKGGEGGLQLNLNFDTADRFLKNIISLEQQMADIRTDLANEYKSFEAAGGDRKMLKVAKRFSTQDPAKTASEKRALDQYYDWFVAPKVRQMQGAEA